MRKFRFETDNGQKFTIHPPRLSVYTRFIRARKDADVYAAMAEIISNNDEDVKIDGESIPDSFTVDDFNRFFDSFSAWVKNEKESDPN